MMLYDLELDDGEAFFYSMEANENDPSLHMLAALDNLTVEQYIEKVVNPEMYAKFKRLRKERFTQETRRELRKERVM
jgi:heat shock protein HspQ